MTEDSSDILETLLEQSWLHIRHAENHRLWFTNMYFLVVAGVLTYLSTQTPPFMTVIFPFLLGFLLLLATLGLIVCIKTDTVQEGYVKAIENIVREMLKTKKGDSTPTYHQYLGYRLLEEPK